VKNEERRAMNNEKWKMEKPFESLEVENEIAQD